MRTIKSKTGYGVIDFLNKRILLFCLLLFLSTLLMSQSLEMNLKAKNYLEAKGEVYFTFTLVNSTLLEKLTRIISIVRVNDNNVYAYANKKGFERFLTYAIDYKVLKHPGEKEYYNTKAIETKGIWDFDTYPTYTEFLGMMEHFNTTYPGICELVDTGNSVLGRDILFVKISDNINVNEAEPRFMYTATMHGDETIGYILMLRLINYLLSNYGVDAEITELIDNTEIWICPLENPDGVYGSGDAITFPVRYNANNIDLNRNYPNPVLGDVPEETPIQPESQSMINLFNSTHFVLSANIHAGAEVANYPWDSWISSQKKHADHNWFYDISLDYATDAQANGAISYFTDPYSSGVTHGGDWYIAYGTRQDYITYYRQGREITFELCSDKYADLNVADLPLYWNYNYPSLINYIKEANYGIQGLVKDSVTNEPIVAKVTVLSHDKDNSYVYSELPHGDYYRPIESGTYSLQFEAEGYLTKIVSDIVAVESQVTEQDVLLVPEITSILNNSKNPSIQISPNPSNGVFNIRSNEEPVLSFVLLDMKGNLILKKEVNSGDFEIDLQNNPKGVYFLKLVTRQNAIFRKLVII